MAEGEESWGCVVRCRAAPSGCGLPSAFWPALRAGPSSGCSRHAPPEASLPPARAADPQPVRQHWDTMIREHAFDSVMERRLFSIDIPSAIELPRLNLPAGNFACFLAWDARGASADAVSAFVEPLLRAGVSYFVCWGPDCERVHDIIDEMVSYPDNDFGVPEDSCVMTSWHASEPLRDALWFFLVNSWPDEHYRDSTHVALAISVGSFEWAAEIMDALDHPREFVKRVSENGAA
jgi:hypothetical protein